KNENLNLLHKLVKAFNTKVHLLHITTRKSVDEENKILQKMDAYAALNNLANVEKHVLEDNDIENGVIHFYESQKVDIVCIGTHGKGNIFHKSVTEKLINHLFKPIISYHLSH